ncbi:uncharacterized protein Z519_06427 [Cladophialophora bantiana CBS 173.52]|uniref:Methyltransferase domain-containing protein n=1 Tax=Cladophialophora bantiana (strain ATCC 10958 / CBS 173.52 / CDC B-1940 / NIH 8579) TaxID=1442370 RepID=A0A0D2HP35_CLAB1|nr:uncharacterized protein Z519_06427 [Cladophialophora bantiana CBS 173.52]KIW92580.1 hypothetical protein Z519_06427 [Cladophialophora bantiana CBS 173.52]
MADSTTHPVGNNPFMKRAYALSSAAQARDLYDEWAAEYDKDLEAEAYAAPKLATQALVDALDGERSHGYGHAHGPGSRRNERDQQLAGLQILDAGCGTGLVGLQLARFGAQGVTGLDISPGMLSVAHRTNVYGALEQADLSNPIAKPDESFDAVICVGTLTRGHVGPQVVQEFVRLVRRRRGLVVATVLDDIFESAGFGAEVKRLRTADADNNAKIEVLRSDVVGLRSSTNVGGRLLVLRRL